jgi:SAM-dependent methyltransferase
MRPFDSRWSPFATPLVLAALTLLYMAPVLQAPSAQHVLDGHDLLNQQYPLYSFIFDSVREGRGLPLWNPYQFAGQSTVTNPQSTLFYPLAWLMALVDVGHGVGWLAALHLWLGGWGMAVFARRLGASRAGALAGGIVYEFSALLGAHLDAGHINFILCQAWLPWVAAAYLHSVAGEQQVSSLPHRRADDMRPSAGEQQVSSLPHRRADDKRPSPA